MGWLEDRMPHWRLVAIAGLLGLGALVPLLITVADLVSCGQPPSEAVIRRGIATDLLDRQLNPWHEYTATLAQCDQACSDRFAIEIIAIDGCHHATKPYLPASEPVEEYWDIRASWAEQPSPVQRTVRFWAAPNGWEVSRPPTSMPSIFVDESGSQHAERVSIPFQ
jgi:hypothetical protein